MSGGREGFLEYWYQALREPIGIAIETDAPERLRQLLYQARAKAADPQLSALMLIVPQGANSTEVFIAHRHNEDLNPSELTNVKG